ncbi:MAG TPA: DUF4097 family beta strand repeat-containing protein [Acidobacteriaceae bacterium]|nr:DUF4097 family beta strand repeat-containing protein [Acidobacteriaceae bacterium]
MTIQKSIAVILILFAGSISAAISGCKSSRTASAQNLSGAGGSGPLNIDKMGGAIEVTNAPNGATLHTMGGDIHIGNVGRFANAKTMGGNITIDHANASVDAKTMGGNITVMDATGPVQATTMAGDVMVRLIDSTSERRDVHLSSNSGTITLIVPKDFPMDVQIKLAYTKNADKTFDIHDNVGLTRHESADWDTSKGTPRKYIYAQGRVGSGQNHVEIDTINGDVVLKQE